MYDNYPNAMMPQTAAGSLGGSITPPHVNPTLRENIDAKIQFYKDEISRLEAIKEKLPALLDVNLRDLREAMQF